MASLSDYIEGHIKLLFDAMDAAGAVELQRRELAERFRCAPSQISYVLATRFTPARGYLVESRRGGGGHIRIWRLRMQAEADLLQAVDSRLDSGVDAATARGLVARLADAGVLDEGDAVAALAAVSSNDELAGPVGELIRSRSLRAVMRFILIQNQAHERE